MRLSPAVTPVLTCLLLATGVSGQVNPRARILITKPIDESQLVTLYGNTRPEAVPANDRGKVAGDTPFELLLQLKRPPELQAAVDEYADAVANPKSPNFHQFLKAAEFANRFGVAPEDLSAIQLWLQSYGFTVGSVSPNLALTFSGTAKQIQAAFHTEIHHLDVDGVSHIANMSDPQIPLALADAVVGVVKMNDFRPQPHVHMKPDYTFPYSSTITLYTLVPADLATIYNLNPAFAAGITGQGQTIMVVEDTDLYTVDDWTTFRNTFGMTRKYPYASLSQVHPHPAAGGPTCTDPGVNGNDGEAILDVEWSSAAAPNAAIVMASCSDVPGNFGGFIALQNTIANGGPLPNVVSISYGESESSMGATYNAYVESLYQTASAAGISVFVSSGDSGGDTTDRGSFASRGINVSGFTSSTYDVSVGGTDFGDTYMHKNSTYWSSTNGPTFGSALSYVPEIPWNGSCASQLLANAFGFATTYGSAGFCNNSPGNTSYVDTAAGSGGPSECVAGAPNRPGVADGTCAGRAKPAWQSLLGNPSDGVRDVPDVSLFASNGYWNHYYIFCYSDPGKGRGGVPCAGQPPSKWAGAGGTSFASPIMAGIQALINQYAGGSGYQGLPNPIYYQLANNEYGTTGTTTCNSTLGNGVASNCVFYDVTLGDNDVVCRALTGTDAGLHNCYLPSGTNGVLSVVNSSYEPAFVTTTGWDFPTGIGTVNAWNLIKAYQAALPAAP